MSDIRVTGSNVGAIGGDNAKIEGINVTFTGNVQHPNADRIVELITTLQEGIDQSNLSGPEKRSAAYELSELAAHLETPDGDERQKGIRHHLARLSESIRENEHLASVVASLAGVIGMAI